MKKRSQVSRPSPKKKKNEEESLADIVLTANEQAHDELRLIYKSIFDTKRSK